MYRSFLRVSSDIILSYKKLNSYYGQGFNLESNYSRIQLLSKLTSEIADCKRSLIAMLAYSACPK